MEGKRKKRPKRRPRPDLIKRRLHASDPEAGVPEEGGADDPEEAPEEEGLSVEDEGAPEAQDAEGVEIEAVAVTAEAAPGEDGDGKDPGSP